MLLPSSTNALNGDFFGVSLDSVFDFHKATTVVSFIVMERGQNLIKCPPGEQSSLLLISKYSELIRICVDEGNNDEVCLELVIFLSYINCVQSFGIF